MKVSNCVKVHGGLTVEKEAEVSYLRNILLPQWLIFTDVKLIPAMEGPPMTNFTFV
jgi:hypothetical protein